MFELSAQDIFIRLLMAVIFAGVIGFDREYNNRPAGMRTHILVCVGATIVAMIQIKIADMALQTIIAHPETAGVIRSDPARLICQVISGIGFLGAGTIVITNRSIRGLTTAASLWAIAGVGLAIGMGYYLLSFIGFAVISCVLILLKRVIRVSTRKKIRIKYVHRAETHEFINRYFINKNIRICDSDFGVDVNEEGRRVYTNNYTIDIPRDMTYLLIAEDLCENKDIRHISLVNI